MTGLPVNIPQRDRVGLGRVIEEGHAGDTLGNLALRICRSPQAAQVTLDVRGKHGHTGITEGFCQALQRDGLARAGGAGDQPVTVGQAQGLGNRLAGEVGTDKQLCGVRHFVTHG